MISVGTDPTFLFLRPTAHCARRNQDGNHKTPLFFAKKNSFARFHEVPFSSALAILAVYCP